MAKYTYDFKHKTEREREQNLAKQFTLHSAEAYSEPFPTSKQGGYLIGGDCFQKKSVTSKSILDVWKGSEYFVA